MTRWWTVMVAGGEARKHFDFQVKTFQWGTTDRLLLSTIKLPFSLTPQWNYPTLQEKGSITLPPAFPINFTSSLPGNFFPFLPSNSFGI